MQDHELPVDDRPLAEKIASAKARPINKSGDLITRGEVVDRVNEVIKSLNILSDDVSRHLRDLWAAKNDQATLLSDLTVESEQRHTEIVRRLHALEQRGFVAWLRRLASSLRGAP